MMWRLGSIGILALISIAGARAQGRGNANWTTTGYDAQRSSWVRTDPKISADSLRKPGFQLLWKIKLEGQLTPLVVLDPYTGFRGHKSLGYLAGSFDDIFGIDIDLGVVEWHNHLSSGLKRQSVVTATCPGGLTSAMARTTNVSIQAAPAGRGGAARGGAAVGAVGEPGRGAVKLPPPAPAVAAAPRPAVAPSAPANPVAVRLNAVYAITSDGMLQTMYVSNGSDAEPPVDFLPPHADAVGLIVIDNVAYAETQRGCNGVPDGVWELDLTSGKVASWNSSATGIRGAAGPAFGPDGTVFATSGGSVVALEAKSLSLKNTFTAGKEEFTSSPVVFAVKDKILVAAATRNGSIYLLDSATMTALHKTSTGSNPEALASWLDAAGVRWILAPTGGAITAWKVTDQNGGLTMESGWVSSAMTSPLTPIVVNGAVFAFSSRDKVLHALDGLTGKELWNSGGAITSSARNGALSAGGSQIFATTDDGTLYAFGFPMEH